MLNAYQFQLVKTFEECGVNFIVIGGMALWFHTGQQTRDLDLWVPVGGRNKDRLADGLYEWNKRCGQSSRPRDEIRNGLVEKKQIRLPKSLYRCRDAGGHDQFIASEDGVDILTSIGCDLEFDVVSDRGSYAFLTISATTMDLAAPGVWMLVACRCGDGRRQWCGVGIVWLDTARLAKLLRPGSDRLPAGGRCASGGRPRPAQAVGGDDEQVGVRQVVGQRDPDTACGDTDMGADLEQPEA